MSEQRPLEYETETARRARRPTARFVGGILTGSVVSAVFWFMTRSDPSGLTPLLGIVVLPLIKVLVSLWLRSLPAWKGFAVGLLVSIGVGFLMFAVVCASEFKITG